MIITGQILKTKDDKVLIGATFPDYLIEKQNIKTVGIEITDGRNISREQQKKIYATFNDISSYTGHVTEELKSIFKTMYLARTGGEWFSLSSVDMTTASDFLQFMIEFCIDHGIPTMDNYLDRAPDIGRYLYRCLATRTCALCGKKAEVHHSGEDKIGMGRNRAKIHHLGLQAVAVCRVHHTEIHNIPESEFYDKYHLWPIKLDEYLCKTLGLKI